MKILDLIRLNKSANIVRNIKTYETENITVTPTLNINYTLINYSQTYDLNESLNVAPSATVTINFASV